jgi:glyoxylase-like metal-dependent hydrolase (beta-lactamase superfamily II)
MEAVLIISYILQPLFKEVFMKDRQFGRLRFICGENRGKYPFNHSLYIDGGDARVIVDPACSLEKLSRLRDKDSVDMVWLSHWHEDHFHYVNLFGDSPLWISERDFPPLTDIEIFLDWYGVKDDSHRDYWKKVMSDEFNYQPKSQARFIRDEEEIDLGQVKVQVIATPGHTPRHLSFFFPAEELLFLGDYDLTAFGPWYGDVASSIDETISSIRRLKEIPAKKWIACHEGGLFEENPGKNWDNYENIIYERERKILEFIKKPHTLKEISASWLIYGKPRKPLEFFEFNERVLVNKHLERLEKQGRIIRDKDQYRKV